MSLRTIRIAPISDAGPQADIKDVSADLESPGSRAYPEYTIGLRVNHRTAGIQSDMIHEILPVGPLQCNCSVFGDEQTREAIVIDPGDNIDAVLAILHKHNLQVK